MYKSTDDLKTIEGPIDVRFNLPTVRFKGLKDDGGRPHEAARLHRTIIAMPNGDLLTTVYGTGESDVTPVPYQPSMVKGRVWVVRSSDKGQSWSTTGEFVAPPDLGTEGLGEAVLCRVNQGPHTGRLICLMRTGRESAEDRLRRRRQNMEPIEELIFAGLDVNRFELWADQFRQYNGAKRKPLDENNLDELRGAVVDPDLDPTPQRSSRRRVRRARAAEVLLDAPGSSRGTATTSPSAPTAARPGPTSSASPPAC